MTSRNLELYMKNHLELHQKWGAVLAFEEMRRLALKIEALKKATAPTAAEELTHISLIKNTQVKL